VNQPGGRRRTRVAAVASGDGFQECPRQFVTRTPMTGFGWKPASTHRTITWAVAGRRCAGPAGAARARRAG
jgi:hypothetical protein